MRNLICTFILASLMNINLISANTFVGQNPVKIQLLNDQSGQIVEIEVTFTSATNINSPNTLSAKGITQSGIKKNDTAMTEKGINQSGLKKNDIAEKGINEAGFRNNSPNFAWSWSNPQASQIFKGATNIVVTKGAILPDGRIIKAGDTMVVTADGFTIAPHREAGSGMATGRRQYEK